jgi:hypothetical protein
LQRPSHWEADTRHQNHRNLHGEIAFIALQLIMLITVIAFPVLVAGGIEKEDRLIKEQIMKADIASDSSETPTPTEDDPMKAMLDAYN